MHLLPQKRRAIDKHIYVRSSFISWTAFVFATALQDDGVRSAPPWTSLHCFVRKEFHVGEWKGVTRNWIVQGNCRLWLTCWNVPVWPTLTDKPPIMYPSALHRPRRTTKLQNLWNYILCRHDLEKTNKRSTAGMWLVMPTAKHGGGSVTIWACFARVEHELLRTAEYFLYIHSHVSSPVL